MRDLFLSIGSLADKLVQLALALMALAVAFAFIAGAVFCWRLVLA